MATAVSAGASDYQRGQDVANTGVKERGVIGRKLVDFYQTARGHLPNRYEVYLYGPYVEEALRVMDRNSFADKYQMTDVKVFPNTLDYYKTTGSPTRGMTRKRRSACAGTPRVSTYQVPRPRRSGS